MNKRYEELDSLRGIAASTVVIHHCLITFSIFLSFYLHDNAGSENLFLNIFSNSPFHIVWAGHEAVILFFVLSGFVLTLMLNKNEVKYSTYVVGRFFRIYLPYITSIIISLIFINFFVDREYSELSRWFNGMWSHSISIKELVSYILMLGYDTHNINTATWSLIHEMRISLVFPFVVVLIYKYNWKITMGMGTVITMTSYMGLTFLSQLLNDSNTISYLLASFGMTIYYCWFFMVGSVLAKNKVTLSRLFEKLNKRIKFGLVIIAAGLYTIEWCLPNLGEYKYSGNLIYQSVAMMLVDVFVALSVSITFVFALNSLYFTKFLKKKPLVFLGKISFSLYLIHPLVLLFMIHLLAGLLPTGIIVTIVPLISVLFAWIMYNLVEIPSVKIGKKVNDFLLNKGRKRAVKPFNAA
jgi:peptidoglycan/LPS O-acetylase OafA/YrhL